VSGVRGPRTAHVGHSTGVPPIDVLIEILVGPVAAELCILGPNLAAEQVVHVSYVRHVPVADVAIH